MIWVILFLGCFSHAPSAAPALSIGDRCDAGDGAACVEMGDLVRRSPNRDRAAVWYGVGCVKADDALSCHRHSQFLLEAGKVDEARVRYEARCGAGDDIACGGLGVLVAGQENATSAEKARGSQLLAKACEGGGPGFCGEIASDALPDVGEARRLYARGCTGFPESCIALGNAIHEGLLGPADRPAMLAAYDLGWTRFKDPMARTFYAMSLLDGADPAALDPQSVTAVAMLREACDAGDGQGCFLAARVDADGLFGEPVDQVQAEERRARSCSLGWADACPANDESKAVPQP